MDTSTEFLFGQSVNALTTPLSLPGGQPAPSSNKSDVNGFSGSYEAVVNHAAKRLQAVWPWQLEEVSGDPTKADMKVIHDYLDPIVDTAIQRAMASTSENAKPSRMKPMSDDSHTILSHLATQTSGKLCSTVHAHLGRCFDKNVDCLFF